MIISHSHRYVFTKLPRTRSRAVRRGVRELYDGAPILDKVSYPGGAPPDATGRRAGQAPRRTVDERRVRCVSASGLELSCWTFGLARMSWPLVGRS